VINIGLHRITCVIFF